MTRPTQRTARSQPQAQEARGSQLELQFLEQLRQAMLPEPEREYRFATPRRYRLDFAWPDRKLGVELEGGIFRSGPQGHSSIGGIKRDMAKHNLAVSLGWRVYRFHVDDLNSNVALNVIAHEFANG